MARPSLTLRFLVRTVIMLLLTVGATTCVCAKKKPPVKLVNINTANSEQLQQVPGIGPATAQKILQMRKSYGPFKSVDDLLAIRGLGQKRLDKMRKYLTVGKAPPSPKPTTPENPSSTHAKSSRSEGRAALPQCGLLQVLAPGPARYPQ